MGNHRSTFHSSALSKWIIYSDNFLVSHVAKRGKISKHIKSDVAVWFNRLSSYTELCDLSLFYKHD